MPVAYHANQCIAKILYKWRLWTFISGLSPAFANNNYHVILLDHTQISVDSVPVYITVEAQ